MKAIKFFQENVFLSISLLLIAFGIFLRFHNLNWGAPYFFHPDERNIASSVSQLSFTSQMNPHFFAYGTFPIYTIYFLGVLKNLVTSNIFHLNNSVLKVSFENAIIIGRFISSLFSILLLLLIFETGKIVGNKKNALIGTVLASLSVGFIQYAHFATFEIWLSLFTLLLLSLLLKYYKTPNLKNLFYIGVITGILVSIKISSTVLLPVSIFAICVVEVLKLKEKSKYSFLNLEKIILRVVVTIAIALIIVFMTSPYFWFDLQGFLSGIRYETNVATGAMPVFYTQGFINSIPIIYQLSKVYPFLLNPFMLLFFILLLPFIILKAVKSRSWKILLVVLFFFVTFFSQAFLYVKWIRYYIPSLAFIYIIIGFYLADTHHYFRKIKHIQNYLIYLLFLICFIFSFAFYKTVLLQNFTTVDAAIWAKHNIPGNSKILSEVYDLGIVPFNQYFSNITLFNFYDLDADKTKSTELKTLTKNSTYIIIPSQRILKDRIEKPKIFPKGYIFYSKLLNGTLGFKKIYETPCDIFCKVLYLNSPIYSFEQTANVFDRPTVVIFKKAR
jgi:hypothetical protein